MQIVHNWKARRSGGRITIIGIDDKFEPVKITAVDEIAVNERGEVVVLKVEHPVAILAKERLRYAAAGNLDRVG